MSFFGRKLLTILASTVLSGAFILSGVVSSAAAAPTGATCKGGSIAPGTYASLRITGICLLDSGNVIVTGDVTIAPKGGLEALFSGSDLGVGRNLVVMDGGLLALGCEPGDLPCMNDSMGNTNDAIYGNLVADEAVLMIVHRDYIGGSVRQKGGGGGFSCKPLFPNGPQAYTDYNNDSIGGNVTVSGLHTCWDGFLGNSVGGTVNWNNNHTAISDGNLMSTSTIRGDLNCFGNSPMPHLSDVTPVKNVVLGTKDGQCESL